MSELTYLLLRLGFLALLWIFVWAVVRMLRSDMFGTRVHVPELATVNSEVMSSEAAPAKIPPKPAPAPVPATKQPSFTELISGGEAKNREPDSGNTDSKGSLNSGLDISVVTPEKLEAVSRKSSRDATTLSIVKGEEVDLADISLIPPRMVIGRNPACEIAITDSYASSQHAELLHTDVGWQITDLGSSNGTSVDGKPLETQQAVLIPLGAKIQVGNTVMKLRA